MTYANYSFTDRGGRLAVFASPVTEGDGEGWCKTFLFIVRCSKKDAFSKRRAREIFNNWKATNKAYYEERRKIWHDGDTEYHVIRHECHPTIDMLRFECTPSNVERYLKILYKKAFPPKECVTKETTKNYIWLD